MNIWQVLLWSLAVFAGLAALYGLHRLGLWLEERGHLYYWHKKPSGSAAGAFVALQKVVEPQAQHILQVQEEADDEDEAAGSDRNRSGQLTDKFGDSPAGRYT